MSEWEEGPAEEESRTRAAFDGCLGDVLSGCAIEGCLTLAVPSVLLAFFLFLR